MKNNWKNWFWSFWLVALALPTVAQESLQTAFRRAYALEAWENTPQDAPGVYLSPTHTFYLARLKAESARQKAETWEWVRFLQDGYGIVRLPYSGEAERISQQSFELLLPANNEWKLSPRAAYSIYARDSKELRLLVQTWFPDAFRHELAQKRLTGRILAEYPEQGVFLLHLSKAEILTTILPSLWIHFADVRPALPSTELAVSGLDLSVNKVNTLHARYPALNGQGQTISIKEYRPDSTDIDFRDRYIPSGISTAFVAMHATTMATIIAGGGNSFYTGKGVAWGAQVSSASFFNLFPESNAYYRSADISVQNHSYGVEIENYYGAEARAYDEHVHQNPEFVHVFSAGNTGDSASIVGPYAGITGFANLTGNFKMGKNILTVGAVDSFYQVERRSSRGPAFDGRIKPELVAFGRDGSSGAAAITSGAVLLLQQAYREAHRAQAPAALIRALLLNSADDLGPEGPDYISGFGNVQALRALEQFQQDNWVRGNLLQGQTFELPIEVPEGALDLRITLAWTDPPAPVNSSQALIHDLDLSLTAGGQTWHPWVLNPHPDSLALPAKRGTDRINNQEQITLSAPSPGTYTIRIQAHQLAPGASQEFFVVYHWSERNTFRWTYPASGDNALAGRSIPLRWETTMEDSTAQISYQYAGSNEWIPIRRPVALPQAYILWETPDTAALAVLRMVTASATFLSDTFSISSPLSPALGFDCSDSRFWSWRPIKGVEQYQLYTFESGYLRPTIRTSDTAAILQKAVYPSVFFAVAPVLQAGKTGMRSPTLRSDFLNAGCYIRNFIANVAGGKALLRLELGTLYQVEEVFFEKKTEGGFIPLYTTPAAGRSMLWEDDDLAEGYTIYRAGIRLKDGRRLYSLESAVLFVVEGRYLLYPNPVSQRESINIASRQPDGDILYIFDRLGRLVLKEELFSETESIPAGQLGSGLFFYYIERGGTRLQWGKIVIQ